MYERRVTQRQSVRAESHRISRCVVSESRVEDDMIKERQRREEEK